MRTKDPDGLWHIAVDPDTRGHPARMRDGRISDAAWSLYAAAGEPLCPACRAHEHETVEQHARRHMGGADGPLGKSGRMTRDRARKRGS